MGGRRAATPGVTPLAAVIGELLVAARRQAGMTRAEASRASGISAQVIEQAETGRIPIMFLDSVGLLQTYGVSLATFGRQMDDALRRSDCQGQGGRPEPQRAPAPHDRAHRSAARSSGKGSAG